MYFEKVFNDFGGEKKISQSLKSQKQFRI